MHYPINNIPNCNIFNGSLFQDLENYELQLDTNDNLHILYNNESISNDNHVTIDINSIIDVINQNSNNNTEVDVWRPALIKNSDHVHYRPILQKTVNDSPIFGIDDIISFQPKFKHWNIIEENNTLKSAMSCNWHINSIYGGSEINYGVLFWYKYTDYGAVSGINFNSLPNNTKFIVETNLTYKDGSGAIPQKTLLIKINNNYIRILDKKNFIISSNNTISNSNPIQFNTEKYVVSIDSIENVLALNNCKLYKDSNLNINDKQLDIFISNGECFSFYYGLADKLRNQRDGMPSRTYLSPGLSKTYREIYHRLTLNKKKFFVPSMSKKSARMLQKLCYVLSTGPLMDLTTIDILYDTDVYSAIQTYTNDIQDLSDINTEISDLYDILKIIYQKYKNLSHYTYKQTLMNNYVNNKIDLFKNLTNKYGCNLLIKGKTKLEYKYNLENGAHAFINTNAFNWRPKNLADTETSYSNSYINIGDISYASDINNNKSTIKIKLNSWSDTEFLEIPLADISIQKNKSAPLYVGKGIYQESNSDPEITFSIGDIFNDNPTSPNATYLWEQVDGPKCLRFNNYSKDRFRTKRFLTANIDTPDVFVRQTGTYTVKCTRSNYGKVESDTLTLTTDPNVTLSDLTINTEITQYPKIMTSNIKSIAFNKNGLVYIIDSDHYVDNNDPNDFDDIGLLGIIALKDIKLDLNKIKSVIRNTNPVPLSLTWDVTTGNCVTSLMYINIENARDEQYKYCQCKSFYSEKIKRRRIKAVGFNPSQLGFSDFYRDIFKSYTFRYHDINGATNTFSTNLSEPENSSTRFAPPVLAYGGYGSGIVDTIGINLPSHPRPVPTTFASFSDTQQVLPHIDDRKDILPSNYTKICHLKEVQPTGDDHYINFKKGHFHPISGWISDSYLDKSNVISYRPDLKNSYEFKGVGFSTLQNITNSSNINVYKSNINLSISNEDSADFTDVYGFYNINTDPKENYNFLTEIYQDDWIFSFDNSCGEPQANYALPNNIANKTIKSIDVNLNFLNHSNIKNIAVWLEVVNPVFNNLNGVIVINNTDGFIDGNKHDNLPTDISNYLDNLELANTGNFLPSSGMRIYLLNQQHISNYNSNFSINFSDLANKFTVTDRALYDQNLLPTNVINNKGFIQPSLASVQNYDDLEINNYIRAIKNNQINNINNYLAKFSGATLGNTKITLNIANIEPIEYNDTQVMDNLNSHNSLLGLSTTSNKYISNIISNNLCSWSVVVHTSDHRENTKNNITNYIDYNYCISDLKPSVGGFSATINRHIDNEYVGSYNPINISGYNFIGDFKDKNFLIPLVNKNAPYQSLANTNQCIYDDQDIPRFVSALSPQFPSLLGYFFQSLPALGLAAFGLVGATAGLSYLTAILSQGGRSDPIVGYLLDLKGAQLNAINSSQFYKPIYASQSYGSSDRSIVAISQDGARWYNIEVPIFKYSNTPIVHKNQYKYFKFHSSIPDSLSGLYKFAYSRLVDPSGLNLSNVVADISVDVTNKAGEQTVQDISLKDKNIVYLNNQTTPSDNGYYMVSKNNWIKLPSTNSIDFLSLNNIDKIFTDNLSDSTISKNIIVDGIRAYNFFSNDETVELSNPSGLTATVLGKSIISTTNGQKTVLTLSSIPSGDGYVFKQDTACNVLFLYKDDTTPTGISDNQNTSFNMWNLEATKSYSLKSSSTPMHEISCIGEGSIGWGTDHIFPQILTSIDTNNINISDNIFNNTINDFYCFNDISITDTNNSNNINILHKDLTSSRDKIQATCYSLHDFNVKFNALNSDNDNLLMKQLNMHSMADIKNKVFIELKSDKFISSTIANSGFICINNDNLFYKSIKFNTEDITKLTARLDDLTTFSSNFDPATVSDIYTISSIKNLTAYYNSLGVDPTGCYQTRSAGTLLSCPKQLALKRIQELYYEKNQIQIALYQNQPNIEVPHISGYIIDNLPTGITISYKENKDLYWINIDPNQPCRVNDELTVKILTTGIAYPQPISQNAGLGTITPVNMISPSPYQQINMPFVGPDYNPEVFANADIGFKQEGTTSYYIVPESRINEQKQLLNSRFPGLNWTLDNEDFIYGQISNGQDFSNSKKIILNDGELPDYIVQLKEIYIRPTGTYRYNSKISDVIDFTKNNIKIKFRSLPRKLKNVDSEYFERYTYDYNGNLVKDLRPPSSVGQLANNFVCWHCFDTNGRYTEIPPYLKMANEMRYRAFFGSIDGMEHKNTFVTDSQEDWEWIPFEYYL